MYNLAIETAQCIRNLAIETALAFVGSSGVETKAGDEIYRLNVIRHWNESCWRDLSFEPKGNTTTATVRGAMPHAIKTT